MKMDFTPKLDLICIMRKKYFYLEKKNHAMHCIAVACYCMKLYEMKIESTAAMAVALLICYSNIHEILLLFIFLHLYL